jgi:hypothetical protein
MLKGIEKPNNKFATILSGNYTEDSIIKIMNFLIDTIFVVFGEMM